MKTILITVLLVATAAGAQAQPEYSTNYAPGLLIQEGDPSGVSDVETFSLADPGATMADLTVGLDITGGYNGDLCAYLKSPNGTLTVLMNQPGVGVNNFGAAGAGMNITLSDLSENPIQNETSSAVLSGLYEPANVLGTFDGSVADGTWTLFVANLGSGGGSPTLVSWSLNLDVNAAPTPEPATWAEGLAGLGLLALARHRRMMGARVAGR
jgi:subtilisin-like proprotein convertase family protein